MRVALARQPSADALAHQSSADEGIPDMAVIKAGSALTRLTLTTLVESLKRARSEGDIASLFDRVMAQGGLKWGAAHVEASPAAVRLERGAHIDFSDEVTDAPVDSVLLQSIDTVLRHVSAVTLPIVWDAVEIQHAGQTEFYDALSAFVETKYLTLTLELPDHTDFVVRFLTDDAIRTNYGQVLPMIAQVQLLAMHLNELVSALRHGQMPPSLLTPKELDVLQWTLAGKTASEAAQALGTTQSVVVRWGNSAAHKLGCAGKHQAAARALHRGLLAR
jgi:DNA-binding CsgD family transcriptional regulator